MVEAGSASHSGGATQKRVLVIEDNDDARSALVAVLELEGFLVAAAADGPKSIAIVREHTFDAVLIDIGLPGMDGYEVARQIQRLGGHRPFLVALTGYGEPEDRRRAVEAGFDTHLVKPVDPAEL